MQPLASYLICFHIFPSFIFGKQLFAVGRTRSCFIRHNVSLFPKCDIVVHSWKIDLEVKMQSVKIYCARCQKDDTRAVIAEINKVCIEFGVRRGIVQLAAIAEDLIRGRKTQNIKQEERELAKQIGLRILTMIGDNHYCDSCRKKIQKEDRRDALRKKFKVIIGKKD